MPKTVKQTRKYRIDPATGLIMSCIDINKFSFFFKPSFALSLTYSMKIRLTLPNGTVRLYQGYSVRQWIMALSDRDDQYNGPKKRLCATTLDDDQEAHIRSLIADIDYVRFINDKVIQKKFLRYQYTVQKKTIFWVNFPATESGVAEALNYAKFVKKYQKTFCQYYEVEALNRSIKKWQKMAVEGMTYIHIEKDYYNGKNNWQCAMPLHYLSSEKRKCNYEGTEEGLAIAKSHRAWVVRYGEMPPWKGTNLSNIKWHTNINSTHEKYIEVEKDKFVLVFFDGERTYHRKYSNLKEATYARNQVLILGDMTPFTLTFTPTPESDFNHPMHVVKTITERQKTRKDYVNREKQQLIHDELIEWIRERNRLNEGLSTHINYYQKIVRPPLTPNIIEAIVMISDRLKNYPKYRKYFGEAFDRMQRRAIDRIDRALHYYKPQRATPFSFLTMLICNCFDAVKLELRNEYQSGNGLPNYASYNDDYMGRETLCNAHGGTDADIIMGEEIDTPDTNNIADIIRQDIAKYMQLASDLNMTFAEYLVLCKSRNQIMTNINSDSK